VPIGPIYHEVHSLDRSQRIQVLLQTDEFSCHLINWINDEESLTSQWFLSYTRNHQRFTEPEGIQRSSQKAPHLLLSCARWIQSTPSHKHCKVHRKTGHDGPDGEHRCNSTLSLTSWLDGSECSASRPGPLPSEKRRGTHCWGCVGPTARME
jgi:hypothetical protein